MIDFSHLITWQNFFNLLDILIVWFLLYQLLKIVSRTKTINLLNGVFVVVLVKVVSSLFGLETIDWIMNHIIQWSVIGMIIIFQPEIRRGLEHIGRLIFESTHRPGASNPIDEMIDQITKASTYMAKRRIGALIAIEKEQSLRDYINTGIAINANISEQLLINIFIPNTPLHDGAVIIQDGKIASATSFLPLSDNPNIPKDLGTRHRAAVGLSELTDSVTVVVSEETGNISLTYKGNIYEDLSESRLREILRGHFSFSPETHPDSNQWLKSVRHILKVSPSLGEKGDKDE